MTTKLLELRPDRDLLNPDFNGYKLSLEKIPTLQKELVSTIERVFPNSEQYSLLHAKLFGLHNFLFNDQFSKNANVYFIDEVWNVQKATVDNVTGRLSEIQKIWEVPQCDDRKPGRYNLSLYFASKDYAILSDGTGMLYFLTTGDRNEDEKWNCVFSEEVLDTNKHFIIVDAVFLTGENNKKEIHCLLNNVERTDEKFCTAVNWVTLNQTEDNNWGAVSLKVLKGPGQFYYSALERNCKFIYIASDKPFKFVLDSENPVIAKPVERKAPVLKVYTWLQKGEDMTLRFNINPNYESKDILVRCQPNHLLVKYKDIVLCEGQLRHSVDAAMTMWSVVKGGILEVLITKTESGLMWDQFIVGDETGHQIMDPKVVHEVHCRLAHLCSDTEVLPTETGPTFSTQQIEECDFVGHDTAIFERICATTHEVTHRINLGSLQLITSVKLSVDMPAALALRHDVDACVWQPFEKAGEWTMKHEGTLFAFGYVQASKQQRKFSTCASNLTYSVVCESTRHAFIYRQSRDVSCGELRNRTTGQRVPCIAEQQVINLGDDEVLGIFAADNVLFMLTEKNLLAHKIS